MNRAKRPAIQDVADRAGVSRAAVSKVIRGAYGTSAAMRQKVEAAMAELNYRPSPGARSLRGSTFTFGVMMPDLRGLFFPDIFDGITRQLEGTPYHTLLGAGCEGKHERDQIETMLSRKMDGLILISPRIPDEFVRQVTQAAPTVFIGRHQAGMGFDTVNNDDESGGWLAVKHLHQLGHRRIAHFIQEPYPQNHHTPPARRLLGYLRAMREFGLEEHIQVHQAATPDQAYRATLQMLQRPDRPTALFAWTDTMALQAMAASEEMGLKVPAELSIVSYDNSTFCAMPRIMLNSIDQSAGLLGEMAASLLIERIEGRTDESHFITPPKLTVRESATVPGAGR